MATLRATLAGIWAFPENKQYDLRGAWKRYRGVVTNYGQQGKVSQGL